MNPNIIYILLKAIKWFTDIMNFMFLLRVILSWVRPRNGNVIVDFIYKFTEPILSPIRNILRKSPLGGSGMPLDFSVFIAMILLQGISRLLVQLIILL